ncbi:MAG: hypothetical protein EAZ16_12400 [Sphingobacteriales bacterium]|nr:MAG: hypothetical protein EAZ16_12400 [Sphingobacteriales bacterium]
MFWLTIFYKFISNGY